MAEACCFKSGSWRLRTRELTFGRTPVLMGIVNVTPDSFSDGGKFFGVEAAVDHALRLAAEGAELIDIGGESTRPYSSPVDVDEELRRVVPVVAAVTRQTKVPVSVDTSKAAVAAEAIANGAEVVNDVTGLEGDSAMLSLCREAGVGVCVMHMRGTPQTMQDAPRYNDVVKDISTYLAARTSTLLESGIDRARVCVDPGIGFGKTLEHNLTLLRHCERFHALGFPVMVGHSRKGFIGKLLAAPDHDPTCGSLGVALAMARQGIQVLRVHDVRQTLEALQLFEAAGGLGEA